MGAFVVAAESGLLGALEAEALLVRCVGEALGTLTEADVIGFAAVAGGFVDGATVTRVSPGSHPPLAPPRAAITISAATRDRRRTVHATSALLTGLGGRF
ncbi:hypothetical protein [Micromonospora coxensis]|uniref:hypothetical protein n=1 Tax=Micromonospora coxensis TaxID=356852 RepID=UPI0012FD4E9F|nr:hypothetical protein [Micromonospora coxensis]